MPRVAPEAMAVPEVRLVASVERAATAVGRIATLCPPPVDEEVTEEAETHRWVVQVAMAALRNPTTTQFPASRLHRAGKVAVADQGFLVARAVPVVRRRHFVGGRLAERVEAVDWVHRVLAVRVEVEATHSRVRR